MRLPCHNNSDLHGVLWFTKFSHRLSHCNLYGACSLFCQFLNYAVIVHSLKFVPGYQHNQGITLVEGALPWWNITEIGNENPECSLKYLSIPSTVSEPTSKMTSVWDSIVLNLIFIFRVTSWETVELFKFSFSNHLIFTTVCLKLSRLNSYRKGSLQSERKNWHRDLLLKCW